MSLRLPAPLRALVQASARTVTYTRWLHLMLAGLVAMVVMMVFPGLEDAPTWQWLRAMAVPVGLAAVFGLGVPVLRQAEGIQARLMLVPGQREPLGPAAAETGIAVTPSGSWPDRWRTALWLALRVALGLPLTVLSVWLLIPAWHLAFVLGGWYALLAPLPPLLLLVLVVSSGALTAALARRLLAPSAAERLAALEQRTERLLEHNRLARELHDSIGHALTTTVVQAGAARAAGSARFTERALTAIEETGRRALEDLERVLRLLREDDEARTAGKPPKLEDASRLLESARASGALVTAETGGGLDAVPAVISREGYRILQEALTNVLRHAGPVPVAVRVAATGEELRLAVRNPLPEPSPPTGTGSGLRGIRERAALLGGAAEAGPAGDEWRLEVRLPLGGYTRG
ncbi:two-component sensor histidine kinase [Streptomyces carminius]|uniref:histidine kinase n=1 Tax=Streptomyces carminius TaxID=2665496 RepID=A0A2M8M160_9ACTN|nr:histidine kinase [Streptomyces carminius]PJE97937.1 two-component sensor histidine kinase [Streptomyces carminius]PJF01764.1 two-component sensor histidine kinase [Streptomyces carminius]